MRPLSARKRTFNDQSLGVGAPRTSTDLLWPTGAAVGDQAQAQAARERAAQALARAQNIPEDQAPAQVRQYEQQYRQAVGQAKEQATQAAGAAAKAVSRGALFGSVAWLVRRWRTGTVYPTLTDLNLAAAPHTSSDPGVQPG